VKGIIEQRSALAVEFGRKPQVLHACQLDCMTIFIDKVQYHSYRGLVAQKPILEQSVVTPALTLTTG
jgi:hypothetical protein